MSEDCPRCRFMRIDLENMETERRIERRKLAALKRELDEARDHSPRMPEAVELFEFWQAKCNHPRSIFSADRKKAVLARLSEGYDLDRLKDAVRGAGVSAFEKNGVRYDDLELICRSGSNVEKFEAKQAQYAKKVQEPREIIAKWRELYGEPIHDPVLDVYIGTCPRCWHKLKARVNGTVVIECDCGADWPKFRNLILHESRTEV